MIRRILAVAFAAVISSIGAQAATITPDMWVYKFSVAPSDLGVSAVNATTTLDAAAEVPEGCESSALPGGKIDVYCRKADPVKLGIDLIGTVEDGLLFYEVTIAFNRSTFLCLGTLLGCDGSGPYVTDFSHVFDYAKGTAAYHIDIFPGFSGDFFSDGNAEETFMLSPLVSSMTGLLARSVDGRWGLGHGG